MTESTLIILKPDAVRRGLVGSILSRFEQKGLALKALEMMTFDTARARALYAPHIGKPFFAELMQFITSGPVVAAILEGPEAIEVVRRLLGPTNSREAPPGTIRGDFGLGIMENAVHAADSAESFKRESAAVFGE